jgi:hypothetical protein
LPQQKYHIFQPQQGLAPSLDIIIQTPIVINLEDDEIVKIDEEVHNEFNLFILSSMSLDNKNHDDPPKKSDSPCIELGDALSTTLDVVALASCSPFAYNEQD